MSVNYFKHSAIWYNRWQMLQMINHQILLITRNCYAKNKSE